MLISVNGCDNKHRQVNVYFCPYTTDRKPASESRHAVRLMVREYEPDSERLLMFYIMPR